MAVEIVRRLLLRDVTPSGGLDTVLLVAYTIDGQGPFLRILRSVDFTEDRIQAAIAPDVDAVRALMGPG